MTPKKIISMLIFSLLFGLSLWYLIFAFLASDFNPLNWNIWLKILYLIFSILTSNALLRRVFTKDQE
jgi:multisubunit Na+/H+ antiporter MnhE subunit